ncbi:MAG: hypothetical protein MRZ79_04775 [Bacteroidia bacterium]|nr:hypothetical protein [Bacteroidia bacterium]
MKTPPSPKAVMVSRKVFWLSLFPHFTRPGAYKKYRHLLKLCGKPEHRHCELTAHEISFHLGIPLKSVIQQVTIDNKVN